MREIPVAIALVLIIALAGYLDSKVPAPSPCSDQARVACEQREAANGIEILCRPMRECSTP